MYLFGGGVVGAVKVLYTRWFFISLCCPVSIGQKDRLYILIFGGIILV